LFTAGILARLDGPVLWVLRQADLFAPGLAGAGLDPDRVVFAEAGKNVLPIMEEGLRHAGLAAVVAELTGRLSLVASRRLQLAAEQAGVLAILIRRSRAFDDPVLNEPTAAITRWRIAALPSPPALPHAPETPGLGRARWQLNLTRCRGGELGSWIVEACDATGRLGLVPDTADRSVAAA
jgi:protein ImuA